MKICERKYFIIGAVLIIVLVASALFIGCLKRGVKILEPTPSKISAIKPHSLHPSSV